MSETIEKIKLSEFEADKANFYKGLESLLDNFKSKYGDKVQIVKLKDAIGFIPNAVYLVNE